MDPYWAALGFTLIETCLSTVVNSYPMYCSGWLWWMTIRHVGHVLFSSRYFTKQLLQTIYTHTNTHNLYSFSKLINSVHITFKCHNDNSIDFQKSRMSHWCEFVKMTQHKPRGKKMKLITLLVLWLKLLKHNFKGSWSVAQWLPLVFNSNIS